MTKAKPHIFSIRLPRFQRWATYGTLAMVAASGVTWLALHDWFQLGWLVAEHRLLVIHGVAAALSLMVIGGLLPLHIRLAWRTRRNLRTGITALAVMGGLGLSGLLLYYGDEEGRNTVRWLHIGVGLLGMVAVPLHVWMGKRRTVQHHAADVHSAQVVRAVHRTG